MIFDDDDELNCRTMPEINFFTNLFFKSTTNAHNVKADIHDKANARNGTMGMTNPVCSFLAPECNITLAWLGLVETDGACLKTKLLPGIAIVPWHKIDYWQAIHLGCADFKNCESILSPILQTVVNNVNICIYNSLTCTYFLQCSPIQSKYKITINCFRTVVIAKCMILNHTVLEYQLSVIKQEQNPLIFLGKKCGSH